MNPNFRCVFRPIYPEDMTGLPFMSVGGFSAVLRDPAHVVVPVATARDRRIDDLIKTKRQLRKTLQIPDPSRKARRLELVAEERETGNFSAARMYLRAAQLAPKPRLP